MTAGPPLVSVVIPTYNRLAFLTEAVQTVLAQTLADHELIVVDDGSTDRTPAMVEGIADPRVSLVPLSHSGLPARARNAGIQRARGRYVAFLDSDDLWDSSKLADQVAALSGRPECRWCTTGVRIVDETGAPHPRWGTHPAPPEGRIFEPLVRRQAGMSTSTLLVERALLLDVGGFDETFVSGEDYDLCVRLALRSPIACVPEPRVRGRIHAGQFVGRGWEWPVIRTLGKMARSAPGWRLRSLCAREALQVALLYASRRARAVLRRVWPRRPDPMPVGRG